MLENSLKAYLWESLPENEFVIYKHSESVPTCFEKIKVTRDKKLNLTCTLWGSKAEAWDSDKKRYPKGTIVNKDNEITEAKLGNKYNVIIKGIHLNSISPSMSTGEITATGEVSELQLSAINATPTETIIYSFLNGADRIESYCSDKLEMNFKNSIDITFDKETSTIKETNYTDIIWGNWIEALNKKLFIGHINEKHTELSAPGTVVFIKDKEVFCKKDIKTLAHYLSFIYGKVIIPIGAKELNKENNLISQTFFSAGHYPIESIIGAGFPPINLSMNKQSHKNEHKEILSKILNAFFDKRNLYLLDNVVSYINISHISFREVAQQPLAAAFDLMNYCYFENNPQKLNLIEKKTFKTIINDFIEKNKHILGEKLSTKLRQSNSLGGNEKNKIMLEDLEIQLNKDELEAFNFRNYVIHGRIKKMKLEEIDTTKYAMFYLSIIYKVILKILDYSGEHIAYSETGFPDKMI